MDKHEKQALLNIETYGCHIIQVSEEDDLPRFSYSIGIQKATSKPDLVIMGLKHDLAGWIINEYNKRLKSGENFELKKHYGGFIRDFDITFIKVDKKHYKEHFGWGIWYNEGYEFNMLQLVFPDTAGNWPWDENAPNEFKKYQPVLSRS